MNSRADIFSGFLLSFYKLSCDSMGKHNPNPEPHIGVLCQHENEYIFQSCLNSYDINIYYEIYAVFKMKLSTSQLFGNDLPGFHLC